MTENLISNRLTPEHFFFSYLWSLITICHKNQDITLLLTILPTLTVSYRWLVYFSTESLHPLISIWATLIAHLGICLQCRRHWFDSWIRRICWRRGRLPTPVFLGFPGGSAGKKKNQPAMWETWIQSLGCKNPLERGIATHPVFWPREFCGLLSPWDLSE